jgi:hypothetical protein
MRNTTSYRPNRNVFGFDQDRAVVAAGGRGMHALAHCASRRRPAMCGKSAIEATGKIERGSILPALPAGWPSTRLALPIERQARSPRAARQWAVC